jgi:ABC transporter substrate binding protein
MVYRIGALGAFDSPGLAGFREGLRELGWEDGRSIVMAFRFAGGRHERYRELAEELARLNVDLLAAANSQSVRAAKEATDTIPIVMFEVGHPVDAGFVASLARPGGNVTGMSGQVSELEGKSVEFLREVAPGMRRVALMWDPNNAGSAGAAKSAQPLVERLGLHFISIPVVACWRGSWPPHGSRAQLVRSGARGCQVRGQDLQGRQAGRPPRRAANQVRVGHQPQDRQGSRPHDPAVAAGACGPGD